MIDALTIAAALGGKKRGRAYWACCPAHAERTPSLKLEDTSALIRHPKDDLATAILAGDVEAAERQRELDRALNGRSG